MTRGAAARAVEVRLSGGGVANEDALDTNVAASRRIDDPRPQVRGDVADVLIAETIEPRHSFVGPAALQEFAKLPSLVVVQDERRSNQAGAAVAALRRRTVAEAAVGDKHRATAVDDFGLERRESGRPAAATAALRAAPARLSART